MGTTETLVCAGQNLLLASHADFIVVGDSSSNAAGGGNPNVCWTVKDDGETVAGGGNYSSQREEFAFTALVANTIMVGFSQLPSSVINRLLDNIHFVKLVVCQRPFSCDALFAARAGPAEIEGEIARPCLSPYYDPCTGIRES